MAAELRLLHRIRLRDGAWGGMEKHFARLVGATAAELQHYVVEAPRGFAPEVAAASAQLAAPPLDPRRWHALPLPRYPAALREAHVCAQARRWQVDRVLNWNLFGDVAPARIAARLGARSLYWERGAAWYESAAPLDAAFGRAYDRYLANSNASRQMLLQRWNVQGDIQVCSPGVVRPALPAAPRALPRDRILRLGFAARLRAFKGGVLAVHALHALAVRGCEAELWVAGDGPDAAALRAQAERLGLASRLRLMGRVSPMDRFYESIDLLLHPALREPYGLSCAEALSVGIPVVATQVDGLPEVVTSGVDGLCVAPTLPLSAFGDYGGDVRDVYPLVYRADRGIVGEPGVPAPEALAAAVLAIVGDEARYRGFSAAALRAHERLSWERQLQRLLQLLR